MTLVVDTDCGVDDAEALMFALSRPDWSVQGVSCVRGSALLDHAVNNVLRVLKICGKDKEGIPVLRGSASSILGIEMERKWPPPMHGIDGFGGVANSFPIDETLVPSQECTAPSWLINMVSARPQEITLVALGPLTNLALAQRLDPRFGANLKHLYIMGGNYKGKGNVTVSAESNFGTDPEAAFIVLKEFNCPITMVPWETCIEHPLPWDWFQQWMGSSNSYKCMAHGRLLENMVKYRLGGNTMRGYHSCDLFAMAAALYPESIIHHQENVHVTVELSGQLTRGQCVVDWVGKLGKKPNVNMVTKLNMENMSPLLEQMH